MITIILCALILILISSPWAWGRASAEPFSDKIWLNRARTALKNMFDSKTKGVKGITWHAGRFNHLSLFDKDKIWRVLLTKLPESEAQRLYPKTYYLPQDLSKIDRLKSDSGFIMKKTHSFARKGLLVVDTANQVRRHANDYDICQALIPNPDLINGYKYDIRMFMVVHHKHGILLYHDGYYSYSNFPYDPKGKNMFSRIGGVHLTNEFYRENNLPMTTRGPRPGSADPKYDESHRKIADMLRQIIDCYPYPLLNDSEKASGLIKIFGLDINIFHDKKGTMYPMLIEMNNNPCLLFPEADWKNKLVYELVTAIRDDHLDRFETIK